MADDGGARAVAQRGAPQSLYEALRHDLFLETCTRKAADAIKRFTDELEETRIRVSTRRAPIAEIISTLLENCDYMEDMKRSCKTPDEAMNREENVREMIRALDEYQKRARTACKVTSTR